MMSSSKQPSQPINLSSLHDAFLLACRGNDLDGLAKISTDLSSIVNELERTSCSQQLVPDDNIKLELPIFSHNAYITSTLATKTQQEIEDLCNQFSQQLSLVADAPHTTQVLPTPSSQDLTAGDSASLLKKWSLMHLSFLFPSKAELGELASQTSMSPSQINLWFRNARTRSGWSKVFAHSNVNKDQARLEALLKEYDTLKFHGSPETFRALLARDEFFQLLDKACSYFAATKQSKSSKPDSIRPWVKEVLGNALATLKEKAAGALDSSRQKLPSRSSRKRARTVKSTPSPLPLSHPSTPTAGPSSTPSTTAESSRSSLSLPSTTGSSSNPGSIPMFSFSPLLGSLSGESLYSGHTSPDPASTSSFHLPQASPILFPHPSTCTPANSVLSPSSLLYEAPEVPPMAPSTLSSTAAPITSNDHSIQFEDADEA